jgi:DNA-binding protein H-NS
LIRINNNIALINNRTYALNAHTGLTKGTIVTDLNALSLDQLKKLKKDIEKAINSFEARRIANARQALEAKAAELGVSLAEVLGGKPFKGAKAAVAAKYAHPENPSLTWSGRGRTPKWIADLEANGGKRDNYAIG